MQQKSTRSGDLKNRSFCKTIPNKYRKKNDVSVLRGSAGVETSAGVPFFPACGVGFLTSWIGLGRALGRQGRRGQF